MSKFFKSAVVVVAGVCLLGGGILIGGVTSSDQSQQVEAAGSQSKTYAVQHHTEDVNCPTDHHIVSAQNVTFQTIPSVEPAADPTPAVETPAAVDPTPAVETPAAVDPTPAVDQSADTTYVATCQNGYNNCPYDGNCIAGQDCMERYNAECNSAQSGHHSESRSSGHHSSGRHSNGHH